MGGVRGRGRADLVGACTSLSTFAVEALLFTFSFNFSISPFRLRSPICRIWYRTSSLKRSPRDSPWLPWLLFSTCCTCLCAVHTLRSLYRVEKQPGTCSLSLMGPIFTLHAQRYLNKRHKFNILGKPPCTCMWVGPIYGGTYQWHTGEPCCSAASFLSSLNVLGSMN